MNREKKNKQKGKHLTYSQRCKIETLLCENYSQRKIAEILGITPSTISREITRSSLIKKSRCNDCLNAKDCTKRHVCGSMSCKKKCSRCNRCKRFCSDYTQAYCSELLDVRKVCNGCQKNGMCSYERKLYKAEEAEKRYKDQLVNTRNGFDLTGAEIETINQLVSPLIMKGQSPYHIKHSLGDELTISESTLRRMINHNELDVRAIDLREAVRRKPRTKRQMKSELVSASKSGHLYEEYLEYIEENDVSIVEMDCVEGKQEDTCAILTLHLVTFHLQLYYIMPEHTADCVVSVLDMLEETLGTELFQMIFELILTDNGHEFWDIEGMERSIINGTRTKIFFCEPNRSDQKGACENNHKLFRNIVPKGTSIDNYMQSDMVLITNHINSYRRKSLFGKSPYEQAMDCLPEDFFMLLGLELIPPQEVILRPSLLSISK